MRSHPRRYGPHSGLVVAFVLVLAIASAFAEKEDGNSNHAGSSADLDTDRPAVVLNVAPVRPVGSYLDTISIHSVSDLELAGMQVHTVDDMAFEMETVVSDHTDGSHQLSMTFTSVQFDLDTLGTTLSCDSNDPKSTTSSEVEQAACQPLYDLIGTTVELVVDDEGHAAADALPPSDQSSTTTTTTTTKSSLSSSSSQLSGPTDQFLSTNRLLNLVANHPVAPGDSWDATQNNNDNGGETFQGTATLLGYKQYRNHDVAVIDIVGTKTIDMEKLKESYAQLASGLGSDVTVGDMNLKATLYYDSQAQFARFTAVDVSFAMQMKSPLDGSDLTIPIQETITSTTQLSD